MNSMDETFIKYAKKSNQKIEENRSFLEKKGLNVNILKFEINNNSYENIKNFLRFNILNDRKITDEKIIISDFDKDKIVIKELEKRYSSCNYKVKYKKDRYFIIDEKYVFETDIAQSFKTIFNQFLRDYYNLQFNEYLKFNGNKECDYDRYVYLLNKLENNDFNFKKEHSNLVELFNDFAGLYHSLGNVVLVPFGYNMSRSHLFNDIYCLSILNLFDKGFDKDMIMTLGCIQNLDYDINFHKEVKEKIRITDKEDNHRVKLTEKQYEKYLKVAIDYIKLKK